MTKVEELHSRVKASIAYLAGIVDYGLSKQSDEAVNTIKMMREDVKTLAELAEKGGSDAV